MFHFTALALIHKFLEVDAGGFVAYGNVDFALRNSEVGNLVVATAAQSLLLQVIAGEDVVYVAFVQNQVSS